VREAVHTRIWKQPKTFLSNGIRKLVDSYKVCGTAGRLRAMYITFSVVFDLPMYSVMLKIHVFCRSLELFNSGDKGLTAIH
jgi:hypothetical protein